MVGKDSLDSSEDALRNPKRWFVRFSLRTAFVSVTLLCIWLGIQVRQATNERAAVVAFRDVEAMFFFDSQIAADVPVYPPLKQVRNSEPRWKSGIRTWIGDEYLDRIASVSFLSKPVAIEHVRLAAKLSQLRELSVQDQTHLGDNVITEVKHLPLETLCLWRTRVTDVGIEQLANSAISKTVKGLGLSGTQVTDASLKHVAKLKRLKILELENTAVSFEAISELARAMPECSIHAPNGFWTDGERWAEDRSGLPSIVLD